MSRFMANKRRVVAVLVAAIAVAISITSIQMASAGGEIGLERAIAAQEANNPHLLSIDGVVGTGVGAGANGHAVLVLLERPGVRGLPAKVDGVQVVPVVTGKIAALHHCKGAHSSAPECEAPPGPEPTPEPSPASPTDKFRPDVPNGVSIGHYNITAGTLGAAASLGGQTVALSNAHVLADVNAGSVGDDVMQPGPYDATGGDDQFGDLLASVPISFAPGAQNVVDAAIASVGDGISLTGATLSDGYGAPKSQIFPWQQLSFRQMVQKYGRTTGQTEGRVFGVNVTVNVSYGTDGVATFVNQIWVRGGGFSAGGDSGSLVVTSDRRPVGLLFAGGASDTFLNPIADVQDALGITIIGE